MKSRVWEVSYSYSEHCCFQTSVLLFNNPVTKEVAEAGYFPYDDRPRTLFETLDVENGDPDIALIVAALRAKYDEPTA